MSLSTTLCLIIVFTFEDFVLIISQMKETSSGFVSVINTLGVSF